MLDPRRFATCFTLAAAAIASPALGQINGQLNKAEEKRVPYADPTTRPASAADRAAREALAKKLPAMKFSGDELQDVIEKLRVETGGNVFVNWRALEAEHVTRDLPVTIDLTGLPAAAALDRLLEHVGGETVNLGWTIDEGVVTISSLRDLAKNTLTRVYDIRRFIRGDATRQADIDKVIRRVRGIDPLSWRDAGGEVGSVRELQGQLIVTQTAELQRRIARELRGDVPDVEKGFPLRSTRTGS